jgi:hypothetical protein
MKKFMDLLDSEKLSGRLQTLELLAVCGPAIMASYLAAHIHSSLGGYLPVVCLRGRLIVQVGWYVEDD